MNQQQKEKILRIMDDMLTLIEQLDKRVTQLEQTTKPKRTEQQNKLDDLARFDHFLN